MKIGQTLCSKVDDKRVKTCDKFTAICSTLLTILTVVLGLIVLTYVFIAPIHVEGTSMENSYHDGQTVVMLRTFSSPDRGDVVIVKHGENENFIKRVVAVGGDSVGFVYSDDMSEVYLYVDTGSGFKKQTEPYIKNGKMIGATNAFKVIKPYSTEQALILGGGLKLKDDELFLLGDNRDSSADSRTYGPFKTDDVKGKVIGKVDNGFLRTIFALLYGDVQ